jgi:hypothetical protein
MGPGTSTVAINTGSEDFEIEGYPPTIISTMGGPGGPNAGPDPQDPLPTPKPEPAPTPADPEQACITRTADVKRDIRTIARIVHGSITKVYTGQSFPGGEINPRGQSFQTAVNRLTKNGFKPATILGVQSFDHPEGDSYKKEFSDGLWYHVIVNYTADPNKPDLPTPLVTAHCHATDPTSLIHITNRILGP